MRIRILKKKFDGLPALNKYTGLKIYDQSNFSGFDEYMNLVLDDACEVHMKKNTRKPLRRIMLKGDNITLIQAKDGAK